MSCIPQIICRVTVAMNDKVVDMPTRGSSTKT